MHLTCLMLPTDPLLLKTTIILLTFTIHPSHQRNSSFNPLLQSFSLIHSQSPPLTLCFITGIVAEMAQKYKQEEGEENLFLLPPVNMDRIPLVDKD
jgi:hypothetical protein